MSPGSVDEVNVLDEGRLGESDGRRDDELVRELERAGVRYRRCGKKEEPSPSCANALVMTSLASEGRLVRIGREAGDAGARRGPLAWLGGGVSCFAGRIGKLYRGYCFCWASRQGTQ